MIKIILIIFSLFWNISVNNVFGKNLSIDCENNKFYKIDNFQNYLFYLSNNFREINWTTDFEFIYNNFNNIIISIRHPFFSLISYTLNNNKNEFTLSFHDDNFKCNNIDNDKFTLNYNKSIICSSKAINDINISFIITSTRNKCGYSNVWKIKNIIKIPSFKSNNSNIPLYNPVILNIISNDTLYLKPEFTELNINFCKLNCNNCNGSVCLKCDKSFILSSSNDCICNSNQEIWNSNKSYENSTYSNNIINNTLNNEILFNRKICLNKSLINISNYNNCKINSNIYFKLSNYNFNFLPTFSFGNINFEISLKDTLNINSLFPCQNNINLNINIDNTLNNLKFYENFPFKIISNVKYINNKFNTEIDVTSLKSYCFKGLLKNKLIEYYNCNLNFQFNFINLNNYNRIDQFKYNIWQFYENKILKKISFYKYVDHNLKYYINSKGLINLKICGNISCTKDLDLNFLYSNDNLLLKININEPNIIYDSQLVYIDIYESNTLNQNFVLVNGVNYVRKVNKYETDIFANFIVKKTGIVYFKIVLKDPKTNVILKNIYYNFKIKIIDRNNNSLKESFPFYILLIVFGGVLFIIIFASIVYCIDKCCYKSSKGIDKFTKSNARDLGLKDNIELKEIDNDFQDYLLNK